MKRTSRDRPPPYRPDFENLTLDETTLDPSASGFVVSKIITI